ncbi:MAG: hypothetical protein GY827_10345, partial [Cytophagales bacterium]|nr:hypothetical protein [Cytophagales bacterium]
MKNHLILVFSLIFSICNTQAQDSLTIKENTYKQKVLSRIGADNCQHESEADDIINYYYRSTPGRLHTNTRNIFNPAKLYFTEVDEEYYLEITDIFGELFLRKGIEKGSKSVEFGGYDQLIIEVVAFAKTEIEKSKQIIARNEKLLKEKEIGIKPIEKKYKLLYRKIAPDFEKIQKLENRIKKLENFKDSLSTIEILKKEIQQIEEKVAPDNKEFMRVGIHFNDLQDEIHNIMKNISGAKSKQKRYGNIIKTKTIASTLIIELKPSTGKKVHMCGRESRKSVLKFNRKKEGIIKENLKSLNTNPITEMDHLILAEFFWSHKYHTDALHYIYEAQKVAKLDSSSISSKYLKSFCCYLNINSTSVTRKPVVYLYPTQEDTIDVNVKYNGKLTFTYPKYNNGWKVIAKPNGQLTNLEDSTYHNYLFWEGETSLSFQDKLNGKEGWVIKGSEVTSFFQTVLPKYGLTPKEYNDFIVYWGPLMQRNKYNYINFYSNEEYNKIASIETSPKADTFLRLFMVYQALDHSITVR